MTVSIWAEDLQITRPGAVDDLIGYYEVELYGLTGRLKGHHYGQAIYGTFERTGRRSLLYLATVWTDRDGKPDHNYVSEFLDDLAMLRRGQVGLMD